MATAPRVANSRIGRDLVPMECTGAHLRRRERRQLHFRSRRQITYLLLSRENEPDPGESVFTGGVRLVRVALDSQDQVP
jgi:hypothetical protein